MVHPPVMRVTTLVTLLTGCLCAVLAGCSSEDQVIELDDIDASADTRADDVGDSKVTDSSAVDTAVIDTAVVDSALETSKPDTSTVDTGPVDVGTTFPCGSDMCGSLEYCKRAMSPGICPAVDAGFCPAGCPGCPVLPVTCETMPMKCWAKPSCGCILVEACGSAAAGDCTEKDGGFTVGCRGV